MCAVKSACCIVILRAVGEIGKTNTERKSLLDLVSILCIAAALDYYVIHILGYNKLKGKRLPFRSEIGSTGESGVVCKCIFYTLVERKSYLSCLGCLCIEGETNSFTNVGFICEDRIKYRDSRVLIGVNSSGNRSCIYLKSGILIIKPCIELIGGLIKRITCRRGSRTAVNTVVLVDLGYNGVTDEIDIRHVLCIADKDESNLVCSL